MPAYGQLEQCNEVGFCILCILHLNLANSFLVVTIIALSWLVAIRTECQKAGIVFATMSKMCNFRQIVGKM